MSESVKKDDLAKALAALQDVAKGHSSRGTKTTEVVSMQQAGVGAGSSGGATQVYHTPSNSDPKGWAGSTPRNVPEDGATDGVSENGTDYAGAGMMKSIIEKMAKGLPLTSEEAAAYAAIAKGKNPFMDKKDDDDKDDDVDKAKSKDDEDDDDMGKSLSDYAGEDDQVSKGLEVSEFLAGWANVQARALEAAEERIVSRVLKSIVSEFQANGEFQKSLADAVATLGEAVSATAQRVDQVESQPARAPRAVQNVHALEKGGFGNHNEPQPLNKAVAAEVLVDLVQKGQATASDVIKFDTTGHLNPTLEAKVRAALGAGR